MSRSETPSYTTLIRAEELNTISRRASCRIVDCRFSLADTGAGERAYCQGHIPGAVYAHLDTVLSNPPTTDHGRHPLPPPEVLAARFGAMGIGPETQVVAYDAAGAMIGPRLWWLLKYVGHDNVAVLDGGLKAWSDAGFPLEEGEPPGPPVAQFIANERAAMFISADGIADMKLVVDSRARERYSGEEEPIDTKAGHIPGAVNLPYAETIAPDGTFLAVDALRSRFSELFRNVVPEDTAFYCGSGVTACVNILAVSAAGIPLPKLYSGSWSDWTSNPDRPVAVGEDP